MQPEEARRLIQQGEGQRVEFKASFSEARAAIQTLCAMTHTGGGTVFFGVRDDATIGGVQLGKKTLEDFANQVRSNTQPPLTLRIDRCTIDGKIIVAVIVQEAPPDSVHLAYNVAYVRVGKTNQVMPPEQQRYRYLSRFRPDIRVCKLRLKEATNHGRNVSKHASGYIGRTGVSFSSTRGVRRLSQDRWPTSSFICVNTVTQNMRIVH